MKAPAWLTELEALRANATPGEWEPTDPDGLSSDVIVAGTTNRSDNTGYVFVDNEGLMGCASAEDARYVCALHNALPQLLALIRAGADA